MGTNNQLPSKRARKSFKRGEDDYLFGEDDYLLGIIVEIDMHNFMTYDHIKSRPGSRLNLVIGLNGTGKRSLVCVIAIGLAREPQGGQYQKEMF
jgi:hypothetical protein